MLSKVMLLCALACSISAGRLNLNGATSGIRFYDTEMNRKGAGEVQVVGSLEITNNLQVSGGLSVVGITTLASNLIQTSGTTTLTTPTVTGLTLVSSTLLVMGITTLGGTVTQSAGSTSLLATTITGTLTMSSLQVDTTTSVNNNIIQTAGTAVLQATTVTALVVTTNVVATGAASFGSVTQNGGTTSFGTTTVTGTLTVTGSFKAATMLVPRVINTEIAANDGYWGPWSATYYCNVGSYACGFRSRFEGQGGDDTAMNGFRLSCCLF